MASPSQSAVGSSSSAFEALQATMLLMRQQMGAYKEEMRQERETLMGEVAAARAQLEQERTAFEQEKERMQDARAKQTDVIHLNVGGRPFTTTRATLCAHEGTLLASMFSGRWEESLQRDPTTGVVFLDWDPSLFEILLNHLRTLTHTPNKPLPTPPFVSPEQKETWVCMLGYFGFTCARAHADIEKLGRFSETESHPDFTISDTGKISVQKGSRDNIVSVVQGSVGQGEKRTWKLQTVGGFCLRFGFMPENLVKKMKENANDAYRTACFVFFREGMFSLPGQARYDGDRLWSTMQEGTHIELVFDMETADSPYVQVKTHSDRKFPIPKETGDTGGYRFFIESSSDGTGMEILSVD